MLDTHFPRPTKYGCISNPLLYSSITPFLSRAAIFYILFFSHFRFPQHNQLVNTWTRRNRPGPISCAR